MRLALLICLILSTARAESLADALYPNTPPPAELHVLVIEHDATGAPLARHVIGDPRSTDWWPASTIKIFAAVAALEYIQELGWDHRARLRFDRPGRKPYVRRLDWLVTQAITHSSNLAYDRLVQFVGHDRLHADLLGPKRGLSDTALQVPYSQNVASLLHSPAIGLKHRKAGLELPARDGKGVTRCALATCASLNSLAEIMRRVMFNAHLAPADRLRISPAALKHLRAALAGDRKRGREVAQALQKALKGRRPQVFHKPGFYPGWRSDVLFVQAGTRRWTIALANAGKRSALNDPARRLARWLARQ